MLKSYMCAAARVLKHKLVVAGRKEQGCSSMSGSDTNEASSVAAAATEQQLHEALLVNYSAVRAWTVRSQPLEAADVLVVPVNESNSHWITIVVCIPRKEIVLLDRCYTRFCGVVGCMFLSHCPVFINRQ